MLEALSTFLAVAAERSFTAVARSQGVAVSSVTRRIDALEQDLGVQLFHRSPRRLILTDAGEHFLSRAQIIVEDLRDAKDSVSALNAEPRGLLTVTAPAMFGRRHVVPAVVEFIRRHPAIEVDLHLSDAVVDLASQRVDVAIRIGVLPDSDLLASQLAPFRRLVCASPDYLAQFERPATPEGLLQHNCMTVASSPAPSGWWCFDGVNRGLPLPVRGGFRSDDTGALLEAALAGLGVVHLASWLVSDMIRSGRLVCLFPDLPPPKRSASVVHAVRMAGRSHTAKAQLFINHLRQAFGSPPYWEQAIGPSAGLPARPEAEGES